MSEENSDENDGSTEMEVRSAQDLQQSIDGFNQPLARYLRELNLPTENVLYPIEERKSVIEALEDALSELPYDERTKSHYLSKFTVAIAAGLFDGALNYLWNETVGALRDFVATFDLQYFYSVLSKINNRYENLRGKEDLEEVNDHDLLEACRRVGLLSDVNYRRLEQINYMRNHASAAHPNEQELDAYEMLGWLRTCLRHAINAEPDPPVIRVKQLLANIRESVIPDQDIPQIGREVSKMGQERVDDLLWTLFGMFTDPQLDSDARTNIKKLGQHVWDGASEDRKHEVGARFGVFRKNAEVERKKLTQEFLSSVDGLRYKDEDSLTAELIEKLDALKEVHFGVDNFYNEYPHAKSLKKSFPKSGDIPRAARNKWVKVISICYIGNGKGYKKGVDERALPHYKKYIDMFSEGEKIAFIKLFNDSEFSTILSRDKTDSRARKMAKRLKEDENDIHLNRALSRVVEFNGSLDKISGSKDYEEAVQYLPTEES